MVACILKETVETRRKRKHFQMRPVTLIQLKELNVAIQFQPMKCCHGLDFTYSFNQVVFYLCMVIFMCAQVHEYEYVPVEVRGQQPVIPPAFPPLLRQGHSLAWSSVGCLACAHQESACFSSAGIAPYLTFHLLKWVLGVKFMFSCMRGKHFTIQVIVSSPVVGDF